LKPQLKGFQQRTVAAALRCLEETSGRRRFLVADEVGLGKTMVARGVIERLRIPGRSFRVFYISSGASVGSQNAKRLMPQGEEHGLSSVDRLGLLHAQPRRGNAAGVELFAFTPDTSFRIRGTGTWMERAFLRALVRKAYGASALRKLERIHPFNATMNEANFRRLSTEYVRRHPPSQKLARSLRRVMRREFGSTAFESLLTNTQNEQTKPVAILRRALAEAALDAHPPDLIICDEFQNYRQLLLGSAGGAKPKQEGKLMHRLLSGTGGVAPRVLLLSATPFRLFMSRWQEATEPAGSEQLEQLLAFLAGSEIANQIMRLFSKFNGALRLFARAMDVAAPACRVEVERLREELEGRMCPIMCRTERPQDLSRSELPLNAREQIDDSISRIDLAGFQHVARVFGAGVVGPLKFRHEAVPFWSSVPLASQALGPSYLAWSEAWGKGSGRLTTTSPGPRLCKGAAPPPATLQAHPKLRKLQLIQPPTASTLPWVAPSLCWWPLGGGWATGQRDKSPEKVLLFSRFRAAPGSIAALTSLSVEAELRHQRAGGKNLRRTAGRPLKLSPKSIGTFALFHPSPWLIRCTEPLAAYGGTWKDYVAAVRKQLRVKLVDQFQLRVVAKTPKGRKLWQLLAGMERLEGDSDIVRRAWLDLPRRTPARDSDGKAKAQELSRSVTATLDRWQLGTEVPKSISRRELTELAVFALEAPGIVAGRALRRCRKNVLETELGSLVSLCWQGFASYLGDPMFQIASGKSGGTQEFIRNWVREGCLESVLDEHLVATSGSSGDGKDSPLELLRQALQMHAGSSTFYPAGPGQEPRSFRVRCHAAVPFGGNEPEVGASAPKVSRSDVLRIAFNSPFRPYLLATTSVGQEGLDFHPWCRTIAHWDLCSSPVDLEQREGRIQRYLGLAGRRALAREYGQTALADTSQLLTAASPWHQILDSAEKASTDNDGLSPWWVTPGAAVQCHLFTMPLSRDHARYEKLRRQRTLYRLALGQPNQEDFIATLEQASPERQKALAELTLRLRPR
jgi:hypothetical protein